MKEARFIKTKKKRWEELEKTIRQKEAKTPDELASMYIELSDDLAFSQTFYPRSETTAYLNELALYFHRRIYRNKKEDRGRFLRFWMEEIPDTYYKARWAMLISFIIFLISALIGAISTHVDPDFVRLILGDAYVDMTLENIRKGDPMAVYSSMKEDSMFAMITTNNIRVSFIVFAFGFLGPFLSAALLIQNGIMLGCFQYFFYQHHALSISAQAIWIHGTIEITSIVIAGGAGIYLSSGFLFPGTYTRLEKFRETAKDGMKIVIALVPFFFIAGFLESFVTRYYQNIFVSLPVIIISLGLVFWYFVYFPIMKHRYAQRIRETGTV
ncbi:MAG: stage II sporulation protein M [Bacteroidota bacterium]|nr:stage II sporulation protein M [Bacteroidota bacterium]MDX5429505.1 stage II sporulation protein M [Bacteroidota bacterium]MDX5468290.1 stage II sporulation protein M [Bacteroidota bacterium]